MDGKEKIQGTPHFKAPLLSKTEQLIASIHKAVNKALFAAGLLVGSVLPVAVTLGTAASLFVACSSDSEEAKDTTPPSVVLNFTTADVTGGKVVQISGNQLWIGDKLIASWTDDVSKECVVTLSLNEQSVTSGMKISEDGTLVLSVQDEAGNVKHRSIQLDVVKGTPQITINISELNIFGGVQVNVSDNQLLLGDSIVASWKDDDPKSCKISLKFQGQEMKSGDSIEEAGKLTFSITNKYGKQANAEITLTSDAIFGLEALQSSTIQVDQEIDLLKGITFVDGVNLIKTEIEFDGKLSTLSDPHHYTPKYPGEISIIFTVQGKNHATTTIRIDELTIQPLEYKSIPINSLKPAEILPIVGQVEWGDKDAYKHIEHLRIAEATKIRDMMWQYGAGSHTPEQYQQLMSRLNTGMILENPVGYTNYEIVGGDLISKPSNHAHDEWDVLNTLIKHANFKIIDGGSRVTKLYNLCTSDPNKINIMGTSIDSDVNKEQYNGWNIERVKKYDEEKNRLIFGAGGNIRYRSDGTVLNKIYQENYDLPDQNSVYMGASRAHNKKDKTLTRHLMVTFGTNKNGDIDQTHEIYESSKFPVGFHDKVLFSGRAFPNNRSDGGGIGAEPGKYATSFSNYVNVAMADLCFQMFAEIKDVDQLLEMIRSTCLTDYIRFDLNGDGDTNDNFDGQPESQPLQLINPAGFFQKYLMPTKLPTSVKSDATVSLDKGYYKGVIFDIPGAEVKVNGKWIDYNEANKAQIKAQNPFKLEWRLNGNPCKKMGYGSSKSMKGKVIVVDDKWNGLNMTKEFSVNLTP